MAISALFSIVLYTISIRELEDSYQRENIVYRLAPNADGWGGTWQLESPVKIYERAQHRLQLNLVLINLAIFLIAGAAAYALARRSLKPIEEALEAQSRFSADASHELRTPLTAMKSEIEVSLRAKDLTVSDARSLLSSTLEEIQKLEALSAGLLKLAQQEKPQLSVSPVQLHFIAEQAISRLEGAARSKNIQINNNAGSELVSGDEESLTELLVTLIDNAIKYSQDGQLIQISSSPGRKHATIMVEDYGAGIAASDIPHIFDRFYRADSSRSKNSIGGYGLGLSIARQIVALHKGTIDVTSKVGKGTTFRVALPVVGIHG